MRIEPNSRKFSGKELYTLALSEPPLFYKPTSNLTKIMQGKGADIGKTDQLQKWAKQKMITQSYLLKLIDVAKKYDDKEFIQQCWRAYHCLSKITTGNGKLFGKYCKTMMCRLCCDIRKAELINEYYPILKKWTDAYHLVLTVKSPTLTGLTIRIDEMYSSFAKIVAKHRRLSRKGKSIRLLGIKCLEILYNPKGTYHCHFHLIVEKRETAAILKREWCNYWGITHANPRRQFYRKVWNMEGALIEIIKYSCKIFTDPDRDKKLQGEVNPKIYAGALYCIYKELSGRRKIDRFGFDAKTHKTKCFTILVNSRDWKHDPKSADYVTDDLDFPLIGFNKPPELEHLLNNCFDTVKN